MLCNSYYCKILYEEFHWIALAQPDYSTAAEWLSLLQVILFVTHRYHNAGKKFWSSLREADLNVYNGCTLNESCTVSLPTALAACNCDNDICGNYAQWAMIDTYYNNIVAALHRASSYAVCRVGYRTIFSNLIGPGQIEIRFHFLA